MSALMNGSLKVPKETFGKEQYNELMEAISGVLVS